MNTRREGTFAKWIYETLENYLSIIEKIESNWTKLPAIESSTISSRCICLTMYRAWKSVPSSFARAVNVSQSYWSGSVRACGMCVRLKETLNVFAALRFRRSVVLVRLRLHRSACVTYAGGHGVRWCTRDSDRPAALFTLVSGRWSSIVCTHRFLSAVALSTFEMARVAWREPPQSVFARATLPIGPSDACRRSSPSPSPSPPTFLSIIRRGRRAALACASLSITVVCVRVLVCARLCVYVCSLCRRVGGRGTRVPRCRLRESNLIVWVRRESLPRVTSSVTRKMRRSSGNAFWGSSRRNGNGQPTSHRTGESSIVFSFSSRLSFADTIYTDE